jgi:hypothetical protein
MLVIFFSNVNTYRKKKLPNKTVDLQIKGLAGLKTRLFKKKK